MTTADPGSTEIVDEFERLLDAGLDENLDALAAELHFAWQCSYPLPERPWDWWRPIWHRAGFIIDGVRDESARPASPVLLYSGGVGQSWSTSRLVPIAYARGRDIRERLVHPTELLGFLSLEREFVEDGIQRSRPAS